MKTLLGERSGALLYPCIEDLVENGPDVAKLEAAEVTPDRQGVTQYLAAWSRHIGLDQETCRVWLTDYALETLAAISGTKPSGIRHSTKSNVRYIYRSEIPFVCGRERNRFRARCNEQCPVYTVMGDQPRWGAPARAIPLPGPGEPLFPERPVPVIAPVVIQEYVPLKKRYREQFEEALKVVKAGLAKRERRETIVKQLNQSGLKTRTGRAWTYGTLAREIDHLKAEEGRVPPAAGEETRGEEARGEEALE